MNNYVLTLLLLFFGILSASISTIFIFSNAQSTPPTCTPKDKSNLDFLWKHIHDFKINHNTTDRLPILNYCIAVTGKLLSQNTDPDGDIHMTLALDPPYLHYSTEKGSRAGTIVTEAICQKPAQYQKAIDACNGVTQGFLKIPPNLTHVAVIGSYVTDNEHGWREIHPISSIYAHP